MPTLQKKDQRDVLFSDPVAIILGNILFEEQLSKPAPGDLYKYLSNQLRLLADVFIVAKTLDPGIRENGVYQNPYSALQTCTILTKLSRKLKSLNLIMNNTNDYEKYNKFELLLKEQQNTKITKL